jgi:hypothetical protein
MQIKPFMIIACSLFAGCSGLYPDIYGDARQAAVKSAVTPISQIAPPGIFAQ